MHRITPYIYYNDVTKAAAWLSKVFGFEITLELPDPSGKIVHAELKLQDAGIMIGLAGELPGTISPEEASQVTQSLYVYGDSLDTHCAHSRAAGAMIRTDIREMFWGDNMYTAQDLEGHHWSFAEHMKDIAPEDMKPEF
jgi:PhnB protein